MNFTLIEMGSAVAAFMIVVGIISYIIGKKKSTTPVRAALLGTVFSVIPVLGIIYVFYLANKEDLVTSK
ncbi:hypothetical protein WNY51_10480 [Pseudocolwellia sp. AS88]|uniref:hypothetical protein n=1 Tax=Pseudocolwellia sp. AS88 TaxID=3063958 RepID=UPI0026EA2369|nr:hypothetical protein [Pseudocolwellia sp. AS88]MDO7086005.1 hypothetical protein [Pseudocolwellia sp. AS88]